jgi:peptidoglycan/xylan/chitin deacetylase (PgdA/CDA1 family)
MISRMHVKSLLGTVLWPFATSIASRRFLRRDQGLVLTFHYIGGPVLRGIGEDLFMPIAEFRRVLDFIAAQLTPLPPAVFFRGLREGTLPERATLITFDDCPQDTVVQALPELTKRGLAGCFFVSPGLIASGRTVPSLELMALCAHAPKGDHQISLVWADDSSSPRTARIVIEDEDSRRAAYRRLFPDLLACPSRCHAALLRQIRAGLGLESDYSFRLRLANWSALSALHANGMLIGNHTMLHSTVTADGIGQFENDVALAYDLIERHIGPQPRVFCYPYGRKVDQPAAAERALADLGTEFAFVTQGGIARPKRSGWLQLHREDASYSANAAKLAPLLAFFR